jgi:hypothetical protein
MTAPHPPKLRSYATRQVLDHGLDAVRELRSAGASWADVGAALDMVGGGRVWGEAGAEHAARAVWEAAGEPGAPRWEDQAMAPDGRWRDAGAARAYFVACHEAFRRWLDAGGPV